MVRGAQQMMHILAPLAVKPEYQRQGIGGMLIRGRYREAGKGSSLCLYWGIKNIIQNMVLYRMQPGWVILLLPDTGTVLRLLDGSGNQSEGI